MYNSWVKCLTPEVCKIISYSIKSRVAIVGRILPSSCERKGKPPEVNVALSHVSHARILLNYLGYERKRNQMQDELSAVSAGKWHRVAA
jgi:hypothetical protein